jgi:hypothetical protein
LSTVLFARNHCAIDIFDAGEIELSFLHLRRSHRTLCLALDLPCGMSLCGAAVCN